MPYLITTSLYPTDKGAEVGKRYLEALSKYPPDENLGINVVPSAVKATAQGISVIGISDVKEGKFEEAYTRAVNMMVMFHSIEGFEYTVDIYLKIEEALPLIGMSLPE